MAASDLALSPMAVPHSDNEPESLHVGHRIELPSGLTLGSRDRAGVEWTVESLRGWHQVDSTGSYTQRAYRHGAWVDRAFYPARVVVVEGKVFAPAGLSHLEQHELISAACDRFLGSIPLDELAEVIVTTGGVARLLRARQDGPQFCDVRAPGTWGEFSLQLVAPDPRRLSAGAERSGSTGLPSTEGGLVIPGRWII